MQECAAEVYLHTDHARALYIDEGHIVDGGKALHGHKPGVLGVGALVADLGACKQSACHAADAHCCCRLGSGVACSRCSCSPATKFAG